ncbi:DUF4105 domain-containing protein [Tenacibaculum sp. MEBiC06402]|uniref:lipoprotein N-acyltransferase Lnb domain-containing protein n=1 Tax=unclassified Tenacibaculum TaxID=2635139 RepID=UPI003B9C4440
MLKKYFFLLLLVSQFSFSQNVQLSIYSEISIITSGPGDDLHEKFGHTAIRVKDPVLNFDLIYNYGIFDFNDPKFYTNFVRGYMKYKLARYDFYYALKSAKEDKRWVKQQVLNLTQQERTEFFHFLQKNALPENASYFYDPFFDNCATRPRDIVKNILKEKLIINEEFVTAPKSLRTLMNEKIHQNSWGSFGINLALGSKLDKIATPEEYMYLPEFLMESYAKSIIRSSKGNEKLIKKTNILLDFEPKEANADFPSPLLVFSIFSLVILLITYFDFKQKRRTKILDFLLFFTTGIIGVLIVFLWFFTNHSTAPNNFNILWSFTPNIVVAFYVIKGKLPNWFSKYILMVLLLLTVIPIIHITGIQKFTYPVIPILILLFGRYLFLYKITSIKK